MIVVTGEALIDLVPEGGLLRPSPGGSPYNVAVGLARLGRRVGYLGPLSDDGFGRLLARGLTEEGADTILATPTRAPTTLAVVHLDAEGRAGYRFYLEGTSAVGVRPEDLPALPHGAALHLSLGAVGLRTVPAGETYRTLLDRERGRRFVSLDPNVRAEAVTDHATYRTLLEEAVACCDLVKVSDEDLAALYPDRDPIEVARRWRDLGPALVVVTRGASGVWAGAPVGEVEVSAIEVEVVDTVGAGDAFTSALLATLAVDHRLTRGSLDHLDTGQLTGALTYAAGAAALACTRRGADPPRTGDW